MLIKVNNISKTFKLYKSPADRLKEIIFRKQYHTEYKAVDNISFEINQGETLGIVGQNGAGKSTILKILTGIYLPDTGSIEIDGKITGLLELGTGFNSEMTGIQNIYMNGMLLGMSKEEIENKKEVIIDFAELGDFIEEPLKTYSSGMIMRLAFAIAINADQKCFVVDEALAVGDAYFQQKCMRKITDFKNKGGAIILVSHDLNSVKLLCDKAILLNKGEVLQIGNPEDIINKYNFLIAKKSDRKDKDILERIENKSFGNFKIEFIDEKIIGEDSNSNIISSGEYCNIEVKFKSNLDFENVTYGFLIRDKFGQDIYGTNTNLENIKLNIKKNQQYIIKTKLRLDIGPGKYTITFALHTEKSHIDNCFHWKDKGCEFEIAGCKSNLFAGIVKLYPEFEMKNVVFRGNDD